jgi:pimeloyl-ACP methyl ester carboxylesterase
MPNNHAGPIGIAGTSAAMLDLPAQVKKRHVFYFSGFDPRGGSYYKRLYRMEARKQTQLNGMQLAIDKGDKSGDIADAWRIHAVTDQQDVETNYEFLRWEDIIRGHWQTNELVIFKQYVGALWAYFLRDALQGVYRASRAPFVTAMFPLVIVLTILLTAAGISWGLNTLLEGSGVPGWLVTLVMLAAGIQGWRMLEKRMNSYWLVRIYAFTRRQGLDGLPVLEARIDAFARHIVEQAAASDADELLFVGHSTGTMIAISALARAMELNPQLVRQGPTISLLTLGHCTPILSLLPPAQRFRDEMEKLANTPEIDWIDFTAPSDGACFAFVDPVANAGLRRNPGVEIKPKLLSPRYPTLFTPARYVELKRDWYRHHFQYLMAGEQVGEYDYFAITAGNLTLAQRFNANKPITNYKKSNKAS